VKEHVARPEARASGFLCGLLDNAVLDSLPWNSMMIKE
jgi:hypothetical protein